MGGRTVNEEGGASGTTGQGGPGQKQVCEGKVRVSLGLLGLRHQRSAVCKHLGSERGPAQGKKRGVTNTQMVPKPQD